jgi:hypothetical protein
MESDFAEMPDFQAVAELQKAAWLAGADPLPVPKPSDFLPNNKRKRSRD